jgi:hypothetical protein
MKVHQVNMSNILANGATDEIHPNSDGPKIPGEGLIHVQRKQTRRVGIDITTQSFTIKHMAISKHNISVPDATLVLITQSSIPKPKYQV